MSAHTNENDDIAMCSNGVASIENTETESVNLTDVAVQGFMQDEEAIPFSLFVKHDAPLPQDFQIVKYDQICHLTIVSAAHGDGDDDDDEDDIM